MNKRRTGGSALPLIKNKRGFLLGEETVKIIIAIIAILFLILFIVYLYNNFTQNKDLTNAKSSLTDLISQINSGATQANIYNPSGWLLSSFTSSPVMPKMCTTNKWINCICLCIKPAGSVHQPQTACDTSGICQQSDFSLVGDATFIVTWQTNSIEISNPTLLLSINQQTKTISKST